MSSLFRDAAIQSQRQRLLGDVVLAQPQSLAVITVFICVAVASVVTFVFLGSYARKETVAGLLSPAKGVVKIHAPGVGVIDQLHASEGQFVDKGTVLISLRGEGVISGGLRVDRQMISAIASQLHEVGIRRTLERDRLGQDQVRLHEELTGLKAEKIALDRQLQIQRNLLGTLEANFDRIHDVAAKGYISSEDLAGREEKILASRQMLASFLQTQAVISSRLKQTQLAIERLPMESADRMSQLSSIESELRLKKLELQSRGSFKLTAPIAGTVTAIQAVIGASANPGAPLLTLLPADSKLEAYLFIPTRAIGFVEVGQEVRLLYEAFDYRRFGAYAGRVTEVSAAVLSPAETSSIINTVEPTYRVTVEISEQTVRAYGQEFSLQAGMLLKADIILENRSLASWILEPLFSIKGRT